MRTALVVTAALLVAVPALAGPGGPPAGGKGEGRGQMREELRARVQQKVRTYLTVELSSKLQLDDAKSMKLADAKPRLSML